MPVLNTNQVAACRNWMTTLALCALSMTLPVSGWAQQNASISALEVRNDRGGSLRDRIYQIRALRQTGQTVRISGSVCYSTCTMFLGLPQTCVSPDTVFGFHGPSSYGKPLDPPVFDHASRLISDHYPTPLQKWYWDTARHEIKRVHKISGTEIIRLGVEAC